MQPRDYLRHTLDPVRLAILGGAAIGPVDVDAIAAELDVARQKVLIQVTRLREAGLLTEENMLDRHTLRHVAAQLPEVEVSPEIVDGDWSSEEAKILSTFFEGSRLTQIPTNRTKRLVVLERLAQEFDIGVRYPEKQVSFLLQLIHPDYAALRRHLVDEDFLTRADGVYWRTGGRFESGPDTGDPDVGGE